MPGMNRPDWLDNIKTIRLHDEEVMIFTTGEDGYYAYLQGGRRLDILRVVSFQPPICDFGDYFSFMFLETPGGFFLLRQHVLENRALSWRVFVEFEAIDQYGMFLDVSNFINSLTKPGEP